MKSTAKVVTAREIAAQTEKQALFKATTLPPSAYGQPIAAAPLPQSLATSARSSSALSATNVSRSRHQSSRQAVDHTRVVKATGPAQQHAGAKQLVQESPSGKARARSKSETSPAPKPRHRSASDAHDSSGRSSSPADDQGAIPYTLRRGMSMYTFKTTRAQQRAFQERKLADRTPSRPQWYSINGSRTGIAFDDVACQKQPGNRSSKYEVMIQAKPGVQKLRASSKSLTRWCKTHITLQSVLIVLQTPRFCV